MSQSRKEIKVGIFVLICLSLLALLLIQFGKGTTFFKPTYTIILTANNVAGLKPRSTVYMAGVPVGTVKKIQLNPDGKGVTIFLRIYEQYVIRKDAKFVIEQSGFLGDQYVDIYPGENKAEPFQNNDTAAVQEPFNLQEVARSASDLIQRVDKTVKNLNDTVNDVRKLALNQETLTNLSAAVMTFRKVSESALSTVDGLNQLVTTNHEPASTAVSNLVLFSEELRKVAGNANGLLDTNAPKITAAVNNIQQSTVLLTNLLQDIESGKGLVGSLLKDPKMAANFSLLSSNLTVTSSNLNRLGLWGILWQHKPPKTKTSSH
jgi:phospholipid/cholesterol/gamma-HCH transport system substrate-binding protein